MSRKVLAAAAAAVAGLLFAGGASGVDIVYPDDPVGDPSAVFGPNAPSTVNSFFPFPPAGPSGNTATIKSGTVSGHVLGGIAATSGVNSTGNLVSIQGGTIGTSTAGGNVFGGWSLDRAAAGNTVEIENALVRGIVFGGWVNGGSLGVDVDGNAVIVGSGATVRDNLYGGYSQGQGGWVRNNSVTIDADASVTKTNAILAGGYSAILQNEVYNNSIAINGGIVNNAAIYGGRGQSGSVVHDNSVIISGGTVANGTIYGGQNINGNGKVSDNEVAILGGSVNAVVYGGFSSRGQATGNTVTIGGSAVLGPASDLYGGFVSSGGGDAFTGNILHKNSAAAAAAVRNFNTVHFSYTGDAGIGALYTTATNSGESGVVVDVQGGNAIDFGGVITGTGALTKTGAGMFALVGGPSLFEGGLNLAAGVFSFTRDDQIVLGAGRAITFTDAATLRFDGDIALGPAQPVVIDTGAPAKFGTLEATAGRTAIVSDLDGRSGSLAKTGAGTLVLTGDSLIRGGGNVQVVDGTLQLGHGGTAGSLDMGLVPGATAFRIEAGAALAYNHSDGVAEAQLISGAGAVVQRGAGPLALTNVNNAFTGGTEIERGALLIASNKTYGQANSLSNRSGYITFTGADRAGETKTVYVLPGIAETTNSFRTAAGSGRENYIDLTFSDIAIKDVDIADPGGAFYVAGGTALTVDANHLVLDRNSAGGAPNDLYVESGGVFNLRVGAYGGDMGWVEFYDGIDGEGTLNIEARGDGLGAMVGLWNDGKNRMGSTYAAGIGGQSLFLDMSRAPSPGSDRIVFEHTDAFVLDGRGHGYGSVVMTGGAAIRAGTGISVVGGAMISPDDWEYGTNHRSAATLALTAPKVVLSDFGLLYTADASGGKAQEPLAFDAEGIPASNNSLLDIASGQVLIDNGLIGVTTLGGASFRPGDYLVIRTDQGINGFADPNTYLTAAMDGFVVNPDAASPRGGYAFALGGDPDPAGNYVVGDKTNVWFRQQLNSLTMAWTGPGGGAPKSGEWATGSFFESLQFAGAGIYENHFLPGDKVYIFGEDSYEIDVPAIALANIVVSGLVVGREMNDSTETGSDYTISGAGGIAVVGDSAFGQYVNSGLSNQLIPTGKLEKFGDGMLEFKNTGGNLFTGGVEISGGTVAIDRGDQLRVGTGAAIAFLGNAALWSRGIVGLEAPIAIGAGVTAKLDAEDGMALLLENAITGASPGSGAVLEKLGAGIVQIGAGGNYLDNTTVHQGTLRVTDAAVYNNSLNFTVLPGSTLAGGGTIIAKNVDIQGNLSPDSAILEENNMAVSGNARYGTLTLDVSDVTSSIKLGDGSVMNKFTMDFDIDAASNGQDDRKDLLVIQGNGPTTTVNGGGAPILGAINFRGPIGWEGAYLVVQGENLASVGYNIGGPGADLNDVLSATLNGVELRSDEPRKTLQFVFGDAYGPGTSTGIDTAIWMEPHINSLTMNWTGAGTEASPGAGGWWHNPTFMSLQDVAGLYHTTTFQHGDEVLIYNPAGAGGPLAVTLSNPLTGEPMNAYVSRLVVGQQAVWGVSARADVTYDGDVEINGIGSLYADRAFAFGEFQAGSNPDLVKSGKLEKYGSGTLTLNNQGANVFTEGTLLDAGTIRIGSATADANGLSRALGFYDLSQGESGKVSFQGDAAAERTVIVEDGVAAIRNYFDVSGEHNVFRNEGDLAISGILNDGTFPSNLGGAFYLNASTGTGSAALTLEAVGNLVLSYNKGYDGGASSPNDILLDSTTGNASLTFQTASGKGVFIQSGIAGIGGGDRIIAIDPDPSRPAGGFVQIEADSTPGALTTVYGKGTLRVVDGTTYGDALSSLLLYGRLEGGGTVGGNAKVFGTVSPDGDTLDPGRAAVEDEKKYAVLTLGADNGMVTLGSLGAEFSFEYDARANNNDYNFALDPDGTRNDLLKLSGATDVVIGQDFTSPGQGVAGTVDFRTGGTMAPGKYLIVNSASDIQLGDGSFASTDANLDAMLRATHDGNAINAVRADYAFRFNDPAKQEAVDLLRQVWLEIDFHSLIMDWTGPASGVWDANTPNFTSQQGNAAYKEHVFRPGDFIHLAGSSAQGDLAIALNSLDTVVSGLVVGADSAGTVLDRDVTLSGPGGIYARTARANGETEIVGRYVADNTLTPSGKLAKWGAGTLRLENTGGNYFEEGIDLHGGTIQFNRADQLGTGNTTIDAGVSVFRGVAFLGDATLQALADVTLANDLWIASGQTGSLDAAAGATFVYAGRMDGSTLSTMNKSGPGTLRIETPGEPSDFAGRMVVSAGTLDVAGDYGLAGGFNVKDGAALAGTGVLGAMAWGGVVESGGTLRPGGLTAFADAATPPVENPLTVNGDLTFAAGSRFDVRIAQFEDGGLLVPYSDRVVVNGTARIERGAILNVAIDYWNQPRTIYDFNADRSGRFTIIDASDGAAEDASARFTFDSNGLGLPRGVFLDQGWNFANGNLFQLWFDYNPADGFGGIGDTHNRVEIGKALDWLIINRDPGLRDLIDRLSDSSWTDDALRKQLDQLHGDLAANALFLALKEPWRHPFNRLRTDSRAAALDAHRDETGPRDAWQAWAEFSGRREHFRRDGNAHAFTAERNGVAFGMDRRLSEESAVGAAFRYSRPKLRQDTGRIDAHDFEIGLYGAARLPFFLDLKGYVGYSGQDYDFRRTVSLPATPSGRYAALCETLKGDARGDALAASVELTRPISGTPDFRLLPTAALDYEKAWIAGWRENGGLTALEYDKSSMERLTARVGLGAEYQTPNKIDLGAKLQYAARVGGPPRPSAGVRFAGAELPNSQAADIWGVDAGRDYLNFGLGAEWKFGAREDKAIHVNYDAKWHRRATLHAFEAGFVKKW